VRTALTLAAVTALAVLTAAATHARAFVPAGHHRVLGFVLVGWALFALAVLALRLVPRRLVGRVVLVGAVLIGVAALADTPNTSTDSARYAWDGIVQDHGVSPYRYAPVDDALAGVRTPWLFPAPVVTAGAGGGTVASCTGERMYTVTSVPSGQPLCTPINRSSVHTIYPPVSEAYFAAVRALVPTTARYWPMQVGGLLVSLGISGMLLRGLRRRGLDPRFAALWAWCPFVASEAVTNSHVDVLGAALLLAAALVAAPVAGSRVAALAAGRRALLTGALVGLGAATKLFPAIAAPPLLRRNPWRVGLAALGTFALTYVPYVATSGTGVLGFLPDYLDQEGYDNGHRFVLVGLLVPWDAATWVSAVLVALLALACWWWADPDEPWHAQVVLVGGTFFIMTPYYSWYALLLVPLVAMSRRWEWMAVPLALSIGQLYPLLYTARPALLSALAIVVAGSVWRAWRARQIDDAAALVPGGTGGTDTAKTVKTAVTVAEPAERKTS
jgi:hypothetical protein